MATQLIATGTGSATSADITVADGSSATVFLKDANGGGIGYCAIVYIEIKDSAGNYTTIGQLTNDDPGTVIAAPGTYRLRRKANGVSVGAEQA